MRQKSKKISILLGIAVCVFGLTACGSSNTRVSGEALDPTVEEQLVSYGESYAQVIEEVVESGQESAFEASYPDEADVFSPAFESYKNAMNDLGTINGFIAEDEYAVLSDTEQVTINIGIDGTGHDADIQIIMPVTVAGGQITNVSDPTSIAVNVRYSLGELMGQAGLNTLLGMGTTFVVLILLAFLISLFKFIPKIQQAFSKKKEEPVPEPEPAAPAPAVEAEEEAVDDGELVAVIAAAVAASEGRTSTDGFVVRSIRKSRKKGW